VRGSNARPLVWTPAPRENCVVFLRRWAVVVTLVVPQQLFPERGAELREGVTSLSLPTDSEENDFRVNRREALKRAAAVGGMFWSIPVINSLIAPAFGQASPVTTQCCRMTGGGKVYFDNNPGGEDCDLATVTADGFLTHGFELHCCPGELPNRLQVNWCTGNSFHLEELVAAQCTNNPAFMPDPPPNKPPSPDDLDTYYGMGNGRVNLQGPGGSFDGSAAWTFEDRGEPGNNDTVNISIYSGPNLTGSLLIHVVGILTDNPGNAQMHCRD
jgi:hypothetical protein